MGGVRLKIENIEELSNFQTLLFQNIEFYELYLH
jgi:hypothetical protein